MSDLEADVAGIHSYELRLIRCTFIFSSEIAITLNSEPQVGSSDGLIKELLTSIECGNYAEVLTSQPCRLVFQLGQDSPPPDSADCFYSELVDRAESFITDTSVSPVEQARRATLVMCIAIAAFLGFTQCNFTGPLKGKELPRFPLPLVEFECAEWDIWARNYLMSDGSDLLGKFSNLQYIVFAKILLMRMKDISIEIRIRSLSWWLGRVLLLEQRILDGRSSCLYDLLHVYMGEALQQFGTSEQVQSYWDADLRDGESLAIVSLLHLEAGIMEYVYGRVDPCRTHFESAEMAAGLQLSLTGVLGFRTVHQVEPKAQMVLVTSTSSSNSGDSHPLTATGIQTCDGSTAGNNLHQASEASDILVVPKLLENTDDSKTRSQDIENGSYVTSNLTATQQAVILAYCLLIEKSSRHDELQRWDMAPYIEAIDSQHFSPFIIRCFCDILRIRWESSRSRTKERALLMMDNLVKHIYESSATIRERIPYSYGVNMTSIPALRKEYGELLVRCGLIGEAIKEFENLELWDNLIYCYSLLEKKATAVELIRKRLSERPNDPKLWCSLGDLTNNDACYEKAVEVTNNKSARAKRSLARSAYNRGDFETSKILWETAMSMNSMYPDGWFAFGYAAFKARDFEKALDAFTRAVQLDPENGDAWNNIACMHLTNKKSNLAFIAFKEALKFKRNSWKLWQNYSTVAFDVGNISQALEGIQMVLDITNNKEVDTTVTDLLESITKEVEKRLSTSNFVPPVTTDNKPNSDEFCIVDSVSELQEQVSGLSTAGRSRDTDQLMSLLGKVLQQIIKNGSGYGPRIWGLYAKWHRIKGELVMCSEALLKQVRSLQGSDTWNDRGRFQKFAKASLELCNVYMEISSSTGSMKELFTAETHLKSVCRQAQSFSDTEEFKDLQACLDEVKIKQQSNSMPN